jgi:hypothetical protein
MALLDPKCHPLLDQIDHQLEQVADAIQSHEVTESGCWEYHRSKNSYGYGRIYLAASPGRVAFNAFAHRVSYAFHHRVDPLNSRVCHKCDNPACINPDHLFLGTHADNMADMAAKRRGLDGEKNHTAKLTEAMVLAVVGEIKKGRSNKQIAERLPISHKQVSLIRLGKSWKHFLAEIGYDPEEYRRFKRKAA